MQTYLKVIKLEFLKSVYEAQAIFPLQNGYEKILKVKNYLDTCNIYVAGTKGI